jgi:uncharacterized protein (TIGR03435 family)
MKKQLLGMAVFAACFFVWQANSPMAQEQPQGASGPLVWPKFEVVSIKECRDKDPSPRSSSSPGRLSLGCWPLWRLINDAYETFADGKVDPLKSPIPLPLEGALEWVRSTKYSISGATDAPQSGAMMRGPMMRAVLEDRFQLKIHRETREVAAYLMTVAKGGFKLKPTEEGSCSRADSTDFTVSPKVPPGGKPWCLNPAMTKKGTLTVFDVHGMTLDVFAKNLHPDGPEGGPVINRTGLTQPFDIHLEWEDDPKQRSQDGSAPSDRDSAVEAVRSELGLRLDPGRGPRDFLVIDHIEKPSDN